VLQAGLTAGFTLFDGGGRLASVREADRREEASRAALARSEGELLTQVAAKYLEVVARRQVLDAQRRRLDALEAELARAALFLSAGKAARVDSLRADAALTAARAEEVTLATGLALAERELSQLTGIPRDSTAAAFLTAVTLTEETLLPAPALIDTALVRNPGILAAGRVLAAEQEAAAAARAARWPRLRLVGAYQYWSDPEGNSSGEWSAGLALSQALFTGGEISGRIARRDAVARQAAEELRLARIQVGHAVQEARDRALAAGARRKSLTASVAQFREVTRIEALSLEAGAGIQTDYLAAQADLFQARAALAEVERALVLAHVDIAHLTAGLTPDWMAAHLEETR
jgi:outer membrane protein TolC